VDSKALAAPIDLEKVNKTTSKDDAWIHQRPQPLFDSEKVIQNRFGAHLKIITKTLYKGDAKIWKRSQPPLTLKKSTKTEWVLTGNRHRKTFER
jgi:hypothetical protein